MRKLITTAALMCATVAHAEFYSGNEIYLRMQGDTYDRMFALAYVSGVYDATVGDWFCPPSGVTTGQARDVVMNFLRMAAEDRNLPASTLSLAALSRAWPCKKGSSS